ncbi:hypothetical protein HPB47_027314 [Ixodes persulcatus]|uniref:Uncharacterized protein n=1 Tax=Ixodes persulcatus TaxID=34615 RepID=A0AC60PWU8_IXOPE|nr:hypothetical protein HPB47_027314 [Ixodes persulcatus]
MTAPTCAQRVPSPGAADGMAEAAEDTATRVSPLRHHHHHVHQHHHHHHHHPRLPELRPESSDDDCPADRTRTRFRPTSSPVSWPLLLALLVLATLQLPQANASGVFELQLRAFSNLLSQDSRGSCCSTGLPPSPGAPCPGTCRTWFRVCLKHYQKTVDTNSPCTYGEVQTPVVASSGPGSTLNLTAPVRFSFDFSWPGTFSLIVEAWHENSNGASSGVGSSHPTLVSRLTTQRWLNVGLDWTSDTLRSERTSLSFSFRVVCEEHYFGADCARLCRPRDDKFGHYACNAKGDVVCLPGWRGDYCSKAICLPGCKEPQGDCDQPNECKCRIGWEGPLCDRCTRYPGCLHGSCQQPWQCNCDEGWGGLFCNQDLNFCTNHRPCQHGGTCTNTGQGSYTCACPPGFAGKDCEVAQDPCRASPCRNGGVCENGDGSYRCRCPPGLTGRHCETAESACAAGPCEAGGTCLEDPRSALDGVAPGFRCLCTDAFTGDRCQIQREPCEPSPCANGGTCTPLPDDSREGFRCTCQAGFAGPRCEVDVDDCASRPCANGGTCVDGADSYRCLCVPGFVGPRCRTDVDDCLTLPCSNGGRCVDLVNDFACRCPPGFSGKDCSVSLDECDSSPCLNGGTCVDGVGRFACHCLRGFSGSRCEYGPGSAAESPPRPVAGSSARQGPFVATDRVGNVVGQDNEDRLTGAHVALIAAFSVAVPVAVLAAALAIVCFRRRRRWRERRDADAVLRQNEHNATHHSMNNKLGGGQVVVNELEKPLQKKQANRVDDGKSGKGGGGVVVSSAPPNNKVLNVECASARSSKLFDAGEGGVYASTRTLNRLHVAAGGEGSSAAGTAAMSPSKSCDLPTNEDDATSESKEHHPQTSSSVVYVIEEHYKDDSLLATEV